MTPEPPPVVPFELTRRAALRAGRLYLLVTLLGPFPMLVVPRLVLAAHDPASYAASHESLVRAAAAVALVVAVTELGLSLLLDRAFGGDPTSDVARLAFVSRASMAVLQVVGAVPWLGVTIAARGATTAFAVGPLVTLGVELAHLWVVVFAVHLGALSRVLSRTREVPRPFPALLAVAAFAYGIDGLGSLVSPTAARFTETFVGIVALTCELPFVLYLVARGKRAGEVTPDAPRHTRRTAGSPTA